MTQDHPAEGDRAPTATGYENCLRRCLTCRVGYSNVRANPTLIHADPTENVPPEVREGVLQTLSNAVNIRNRSNKIRKLGYSTSEDAVTWTVFTFLASHRPDVLRGLGETPFGLVPGDDGRILLWGVPITPGPNNLDVRDTLITATAVLGEDPRSRSEPDVMIDYGSAGLVVIEVKYRSRNDHRVEANWRPYLEDSPAFRDPRTAQASGLYELVRNWRLAHDLAAGRPFTVVNLAPAQTLATTAGMDLFTASLGTSPTRRFLPLRWDAFLTAVERLSGGWPPWLASYLRSRELP